MSSILVQAIEQGKLEASAGEVWKYVAFVLAGVVGALALIIWKDVQEDKKDAKEREERLRALLERKGGGS